MNSLDLARSMWQLFSDQRWDEAGLLLHGDFIAEWPQSRERLKGSGFIEMNRNYPGNHKIEIIHLHEIGEQVVTTVWIVADSGQKTFATSYFSFRDGKIIGLEEYWAEPYEAPVSRRKWVELY